MSSASESSVVLKSTYSTKDLRGSSPSGGRPPFSKPYLNKSGTSSNLTLRSSTTVHAPPVPSQELHRFGERDLPRMPLPLPPVESPNDDSEVDFLQNDESPQSLSPPQSYPTTEDDMQRKPPPNILSSLNSGLFHEVDPIESSQWEENLIPPAPPPKVIPGRSTSMAISLSPSSSDVSTSATGLSLSASESRFTDHSSDHNDDQLFSSTSATSEPTKLLSTTSSAASTSCTTNQAPTLNSHWSDDSGVDIRPVIAKKPDIPPNPRQHRLLDVIYTEMHAARSVNLTPIGLIENRIRTHFKSTCYLLRLSCLGILLTSFSFQTSVLVHP